jgi:hypothetical protein
MKTVKVCLAICLVFSQFTLFGQIRVILNGGAKFGNEWPNNNPNSEISHEVFGLNNTNFRPGGRISFGDYGSSANGSANVFLGEMDYWDTDALQLHGKNGLFLTVGPGGWYTAAQISSVGDAHFYGTLTAQSLPQSDIRLKTNIKTMTGVLPTLMKLQAITYDFKSDREDAELAKISNVKGITTKETTALADFKKALEKKKLDVMNQIGFSAQDVQKVLPQVVRENTKGYLGVNYDAIVAVLVEGIKEQQAVIEAQKAEIDAMKKDIEFLKSKIK